jgi:hypothetical protein
MCGWKGTGGGGGEGGESACRRGSGVRAGSVYRMNIEAQGGCGMDVCVCKHLMSGCLPSIAASAD